MLYRIKHALIIPQAGGTLVHLPTPPQSADSGGHKIVFVKSWKEATLIAIIICTLALCRLITISDHM